MLNIAVSRLNSTLSFIDIIITTAGFLFTWTPYAITLFLSAFRGKHAAVPSLITFFCACFAKTSAIWIPLLYMSTSTQFKLKFLAVDSSESSPLAGKAIKKPTIHKLVVIHERDGSCLTQAAPPSTIVTKLSLPTNNQLLVDTEDTSRSDN